MKIYLSGPIFGCDDGEAKNWREYLIRKYGQGRGDTCYDYYFLNPMRRDFRGKGAESINRIVHLDKLDILKSYAVIVYYTKPSVGTAMEIMFAFDRSIPVFVVTQEKKVSPWLLYHATAIVKTFDEAMDEIASMV